MFVHMLLHKSNSLTIDSRFVSYFVLLAFLRFVAQRGLSITVTPKYSIPHAKND